MSNISFEYAEYKLEMLSRYFPEFSEELNRARNYMRSDTRSSIVHMRLTLEKVMLEVWKSKFPNGGQTEPSLFEIINDPKIKETVERRIYSRLNSLRITGNLAAHPNSLNKSDGLICADHLFEVLNWYQITQRKLPPLPIPDEPPHPLKRYLVDGLRSPYFLLLISLNWLFLVLITRIKFIFPVFGGSAIGKVYEGVFNSSIYSLSGALFTFTYTFCIIFITFISAWLVFKRFRKQNLVSRIISFELLFAVFFSIQLLFLILMDPFTKMF